MSYLDLRETTDYEIIQGDLRPIVQKAVEFYGSGESEPGMILRLAAGSELNFDLANLCVSSAWNDFLLKILLEW